MIIGTPHQIRSVIAEAGRQADFYDSRGDEQLSGMWRDIEDMAVEARRTGQSLLMEIRTKVPTPIKACE